MWLAAVDNIHCVFLVLLVHLSAITSLTPSENEAEVAVISVDKRSYDVRRKEKHPSASENLLSGRPNIFQTENCTVITAQIGGTTTLPCVVRKFNNGVVSWIRKVDYSLLTVGITTYSADTRFLVEHARHLQNWGLQIKHVHPQDAGFYECQVSTHPPTSIFIELKVTEAAAEILGAPDLLIRSGSTLRLVCTVLHSTEPPVFVFWYHDDRMINYDVSRGVSVLADKASSVLVIKEATKGDDGNYTCAPSNARPASINVHVLNATDSEKPAAMQHAGGPSTITTTTSNILAIVSFALLEIFR